jgi:hypothetical protein
VQNFTLTAYTIKILHKSSPPHANQQSPREEKSPLPQNPILTISSNATKEDPQSDPCNRPPNALLPNGLRRAQKLEEKHPNSIIKKQNEAYSQGLRKPRTRTRICVVREDERKTMTSTDA